MLIMVFKHPHKYGLMAMISQRDNDKFDLYRESLNPFVKFFMEKDFFCDVAPQHISLCYFSYPDKYPKEYVKKLVPKIIDIIKDKILTPIEIKIENKSNNSLENVQFSFPLLASSQSIIFITKNFAAGRHFLILKKYFPNIPIFQKTYEPVYPDNNSIIISKNNWSNNVLTASRVWGEFLRIKSFEGSGNNYT